MTYLAETTRVPADQTSDQTRSWLEGIEDVLATLDVPAWVIDPMGRRLHSNSEGNTSLDSALRVDKASQSKVSPINDEQVFAWHKAITRAQSKGVASIAIETDSGPCLIRMHLLEFSKRIRRQDVVIVLYGPREKSCNAEMLRAFGKANNLTDTELQILELLIDNVSPANIAERRGVSEWTVRAQIKSFLNKTGTHSMRDLMLAVSTLPPAS